MDMTLIDAETEEPIGDATEAQVMWADDAPGTVFTVCVDCDGEVVWDDQSRDLHFVVLGHQSKKVYLV